MSRKLYVARSSRIAARMLGDEMLVMSGQGSTLFTLNPTATILWQAADGATSARRNCGTPHLPPVRRRARAGAARCRGTG